MNKSHITYFQTIIQKINGWTRLSSQTQLFRTRYYNRNIVARLLVSQSLLIGKGKRGREGETKKTNSSGFTQNKARTKVQNNKLQSFEETQRKKLDQILNRDNW